MGHPVCSRLRVSEAKVWCWGAVTFAQAFSARESTTRHWLMASDKLFDFSKPRLFVCRREINSILTSRGVMAVTGVYWTLGHGWAGSTSKEKVSAGALGPRGRLCLSLAPATHTAACWAPGWVGPLPGFPSPATPTDSPGADTDTVPLHLSSHPEFPYTPSPPEHGRRAGPVPTAIIGGVAGSIMLVLLVVGGIVVALRRRRHTFKGDYSTKKHVYGNGYSKAGIPQHHPPMAQNLQYPEDSDDEKKAGPLGGSSYEEEEEEEEGGGGERKVGGPHPKYDEDAKRPYFTVDEAEARQDGCYGDRTLGYQYDPEQLDLAENMVSQNDGSFISKKEWYV